MTDDPIYESIIEWFEKRNIKPDKFYLDGNFLKAEYGNYTYILGYLCRQDLADALNNYFRVGSSRVTRHIEKLKQLQKDRGK